MTRVIVIIVLAIIVAAGTLYFWFLGNTQKFTQGINTSPSNPLGQVVLDSLGQAQMKARDSLRVADLRQIQNALELWYDAHNNSYPDKLEMLNELNISDNAVKELYNVPKDPATKQPYFYARCGTQNYHLGANLETSNSVLQSGSHKAPMCASDKINGTGNNGCDGKEGFFCYDITM